jgi:hypothetical protein
MASLANHIDRWLSSGECLTALGITFRLNAEFSTSPYRIPEVVACAEKMPNLHKSGKEYCRRDG